METSLLNIIGLTVDIEGHRLLDEVSITVEPGRVHALVGANGSGKTTLARLLIGTEGYRASSGSVRYAADDLIALPMHERARRGIAIAWQDPVELEGLRIADYLGCGAVKLKAADCLKQVGLDPEVYLRRPLDNSLSGGERRRIELAAVLSLSPRLAILDEPTAGIDLSSLPLIEATVLALRQAGTAVLLITHEESLALRADSASQMCGGRVVFSGDPQSVVERYKRRICSQCDGTTCHDRNKTEIL